MEPVNTLNIDWKTIGPAILILFWVLGWFFNILLSTSGDSSKKKKK